MDPVEDPSEPMHGITSQQGNKGLNEGQCNCHESCTKTFILVAN
jgi:hypothetical protein